MLKKLLGVSCLVLATSAVQAQSFPSTDDAIAYRQGAFQVLSAHMNVLRPVMRGQTPYNAESVQKTADLIATLAELPWAGFGPGTEGGNAKKDIWANNKAFEDTRAQFIVNVKALKEAAGKGDLELVKKSFNDVGQSCRTCHDNFRHKR
ncbi:c-type cytochrome [Pelistega suis]|uniref:c-type cytochrome n=1 Tax=Pelistega suis TaxID=1631957 RepID=UPI00211C2D8B|nr:cytochrome c [Pelistega suis]MCQ9329054.1 cytochrome c [Pelistega suis]